MTKDKALKMAIEEQIEWIEGWAKAYPESIFPPVSEEESQALEEFKKHLGMRIAAQMGRHIGQRFETVVKTLNACKEALEQPAQEPIYIIGEGWKCDKFPEEGTKLYTQPALSWQGLSDDEIDRIYGEVQDNCVKDFPSELYEAWFNALKEKNG